MKKSGKRACHVVNLNFAIDSLLTLQISLGIVAPKKVVLCPSGDSRMESTTWKATSCWPVKNVSTCTLKTVFRFSGSCKEER